MIFINFYNFFRYYDDEESYYAEKINYHTGDYKDFYKEFEAKKNRLDDSLVNYFS